jgi:hypothetical protein
MNVCKHLCVRDLLAVRLTCKEVYARMKNNYMWLKARERILADFPGCFDAFFEMHKRDMYGAFAQLDQNIPRIGEARCMLTHVRKMQQMEQKCISIKAALLHCIQIETDCGLISATNISNESLTFSIGCNHVSYENCLAVFESNNREVVVHFPNGIMSFKTRTLLIKLRQKILFGKKK